MKQQVTLNLGGAQVVRFFVAPSEQNTYNVSLDGLSGKFVSVGGSINAKVWGYVFTAAMVYKPNITVAFLRGQAQPIIASAVTDQDGRYTIEEIPPGGYFVQLYDSAGKPHGYRTATLEAGKTTQLNIIYS